MSMMYRNNEYRELAIDALAQVLVEGATRVDGAVEANGADAAQIVALEQVTVAFGALAALHRPQVHRAQMLQRRRDERRYEPTHLVEAGGGGIVLVYMRYK